MTLSLGFDSFAAVLRHIKGEDWLDGSERLCPSGNSG